MNGNETPEDAFERGLALGSERGYKLGYDEATVEITEKLTRKHDAEMSDKIHNMDGQHTINMSNMAFKIRMLNHEMKMLRQALYDEQRKNR